MTLFVHSVYMRIAMHLADYMAERGLSDEDVAGATGRSRVSISRYRRKLLRPDWTTMQVIRLWSRGKVTEADWRDPATERLARQIIAKVA